MELPIRMKPQPCSFCHYLCRDPGGVEAAHSRAFYPGGGFLFRRGHGAILLAGGLLAGAGGKMLKSIDARALLTHFVKHRLQYSNGGSHGGFPFPRQPLGAFDALVIAQQMHDASVYTKPPQLGLKTRHTARYV